MIQNKTCKKCNIEKSVEHFPAKEYTCKDCKKIIKKKWDEKNKEKCTQYRIDNKEKIKEYYKTYKLNNQEKEKKRYKEYYENNKNKLKKYVEDNKQKRSEYLKIYYQNNKEKLKQRSRENAKNKKEHISLNAKKYREDNKEKIKQCRHQFYKNILKYDNDFIFKTKISSLFKQGLKLKNLKKNKSFFKYTGIKYEDYINYFKKNYEIEYSIYSDSNRKGEYHIDHIIPCSVYDFNNADDLSKCWDYRNLRIISVKENLKKRNNLDYDLINKHNINDLLPDSFKFKKVCNE